MDSTYRYGIDRPRISRSPTARSPTSFPPWAQRAYSSLDGSQRRHAGTGERPDVILTRVGLVPEADLAECFATTLGLPLITADDFPPTLSRRTDFAPRFSNEASGRR